MQRYILAFLLVICCSPALAADVAFKNVRARTAAQAYEDAQSKAREAYFEQLKIAIKESGAKGDLAEANQLAAEKESLELEQKRNGNDPLKLAARKLRNTKWRAASGTWIRFLSGNRTVTYSGAGGVWMMVNKSTALTQSDSGAIYVFKFDKQLKSSTHYKFVGSKKGSALVRE
jgi:hypothetical protein